MAKKIEIYENTLLKLLVRRGIDIDRKNVVLSEGELGYTTDTKKLYIGDGQTAGGVLVGGNRVLSPTNNILSLTDIVEGDIVYSPSDGKLYRFKGGVNDALSDWEIIGSNYNAGDSTIVINGNKITVGELSAGNIHPDALGKSLALDNTGRITLSSSNITIDNITSSASDGYLSLPGQLKINTVKYNWPTNNGESNSYLSTDISGNLNWKQLESTTTVLATSTASQIPVGSIMPFVSSANAPIGWLLCNGQSVLGVDYPALSAVIGTTYGGNTTTFKVPDLINKTLYGVQNTPGASTLYTLASSTTSSLSATGTLFLIKAVTDPVASSTLTVNSPLTCFVDGVDRTNEPVSPYEGDIVIGTAPPREIAGSSGYRNKVTNGNFDFWQRGISTVNSPVSAITRSRTADRWLTYATGVNNSTFSVTRQPCTLTELDNFNANFYQRLTYKNGVGGSRLYSLEQFIGPDTDINIIADTSGSMSTTVTVLRAMVASGALKTRLLPFYNNNEALYNQRVKFVEDSSEKTYSTGMLNSPSRGGTKLINLVFQDETNGAYNDTNNSRYNTDVTALRTTLGGYAPGFFVGIVFQVVGYPTFKTFLQNVKLGLAPFTTLNLQDKPEIKHTYDVLAGNTQQYYVDTIVNSILSLDINVVTEGSSSYDSMDRNDFGALAIQSIENAAEVLGKTMTLSFWARASQPTKIFSETQIHSAQRPLWTPTISKVFNLTTSWQKFTHTYTMPTFQQVSAVAYDPTLIPTPVPTVPAYTPLHLSNSLPPLSSWLYQVDIKTHWTKGEFTKHGNAWDGTTSYRPGSAVNYPGVAMTLQELRDVDTSVLSGVEGYYDIAQIQLEEGDTPTDFEFKPPSVELGMCQRYYFKTYDTETPPNTVTDDGSIWTHEPIAPGSGTIHCAQGSFAVPMAKLPKITFFNPRNASATAGAYGSVFVEGATNTNGTVTSVAASTRRVSYLQTGFAYPSPPASNLIAAGYHFTADAEI